MATAVRVVPRAGAPARARVAARAKKGGAFLKEFGPEDEKPTQSSKKRASASKGMTENDQRGFPALEKVEGSDPFSVNLMVKKVGPMNVVWNGVGTLQVPDAGDKRASVDLARICLAQRAEVLIENFERLYPKMKSARVEWAMQPFDDAYGDPFDPFMTLPEDQVAEFVPGNLQFLKKPKLVAPGAQ